MPVYAYVCEPCGKQEEVFHWVRPDKLEAPSCCGTVMERDWGVEHGGHRPASGYPFVSTNFNGKPIEVKSAAHHRELCRVHNVRVRDDAGFLEDRMEVREVEVPRPGKQYVEFGGQRIPLSPTVKIKTSVQVNGNGRGLPGSWV